MLPRITLTIALALLAAAPAAAQQVGVEYDGEYDFSRIKTVGWAPGDPAPNELNQQRIVTAIQQELMDKGLKWVFENPDAYVVTHAGVHAVGSGKSSKVTVSVGIAQYGRYGGVAYGGTVGGNQSIPVGTLVIELVDASSKEVVWWAQASNALNINMDTIGRVIDSAVKKSFAHFPPAPQEAVEPQP